MNLNEIVSSLCRAHLKKKVRRVQFWQKAPERSYFNDKCGLKPATYSLAILLYHAHRDSNQSGAEKDNRLLF